MQFSQDIFRHRMPRRVLSYHVDRQNVVHSNWYFYYFEEARLEYVRAIGMPMDSETFVTHHRGFVVRNTCDYFAPAFFDEELRILTRITFVRNSSIGFEQFAVSPAGKPLARGEHVFVHVDARSDRPSRVPDTLRELIRSYEGENVRFIEEGD